MYMSLNMITLSLMIVQEIELWVHQKNEFAEEYNREEKEAFEKRIEEKIDSKNPEEVHNYLAMYANPVSNKKQLSTTSSPGS